MATKPLVFIVGPTASGKSALAIDIAKACGGEIICADSRTIYRGLDVSTAKPTLQERAGIVHYGLDIVEPNERFSAANFKTYAQDKINDIQARGKLPIIVGGTGLYIDGLLFNFAFGPAADESKRARLELLGIEQLQEKINKLGLPMPQNYKNKRYLIRAIEQGGVNTKKQPIMNGAIVVGLAPNKQILSERIQKRALTILQGGALAEAQWLFTKYGYDAPAAGAPFFKAFAPHFLVYKSTADCREQNVQYDRQLSKRQLTWFKRNPHTIWFEDSKAAYNFVLSKI